MQHADIAQAVERHIGNVEVTGSTPVISLFLMAESIGFIGFPLFFAYYET